MANSENPKTDMEFANLTHNVSIPVLGLGTWDMGGQLMPDTTRDWEEVQAVKTAIRLGVTHIDTAEMYGRGHSEELVGEAIADFRREDLFITTKVSPEHLRYNDVIAAAGGSLRRLKTDNIDLYLVHVPNLSIPIQETMKAFDFLCKEGLVKFIGVSNFTVDQIREAQKYTRNKIVANQIEYNLLIRNRGGEYTSGMESTIIPYCQENDIVVIAYRPLARGRLVRPGFRVLDELAQKYNKTLDQIAINWLISKQGIITIPKTTNIAHLKENLGAMGWRLEHQDMWRLNNQFETENL